MGTILRKSFKKVLDRRTFKIAATVAFLFIGTIYLKSFAFNGPTGPGGTGSGAIGSDNNNNVSFGTSTTSNTTKLLIVASSTNSGEYALRIVQPGLGPILVVRNDGNIGIGTSTPGSALTVNGTIFSTSAFTGTISAQNVSSGQFGGSTGGGNYSFPASLGIGTSTPSAKLYVYQSSNVTTDLLALDITGDKVLDFTYDAVNSPYPVKVTTAGTRPIAFQLNGGNVGIGTTGPRGKLEIPSNTAGSVIFGTPNEITVGTVDIGSAAGGTPLSLTDATNAHIYFDFGSFGAKMRSDADLVLGTAGPTVAMTLKGTSGNVGIGTAAPSYPLQVSRSAADQYIGWFENTQASPGGARLRVQNTATQGSFEIDVGTDGNTVFQTGKSNNSPTLSILSGNVGIGTTGPGQKLSVVGTIESTSGGFKFPDGTTQTTAASGGSTINATNVSAGTFGANTGGGTYYFSGGIGRTAHSSGFLLGSYNNVGGNDTKTNPIYAIGSSYVPTDTSLSNMYGVGYSHSNFWGAGKSSGWGLYVASAGTVYDTISDGGIWTAGSLVTGTTIRAGTYMYTPTLALNDQLTLNSDSGGAYLGDRSVNNSSGGIHVLRNDSNSWGYFYADGGGIGVLNGAGNWAIRANGAVNGTNTDILFYTNNVQRLQLDGAGSLIFAAANPYITASSYFVAPGGAYFNSGTVYTEAQIKARGGIGTDTSAYLTLAGGTSGITYFSGNVGIGTTSPGYPLDVEGRIRAHNGEVIASIGNSTRALLSTSGAHGIVWLYDINDIKQVSISAGANSYFDGGNVGIGTPVPNYPLTVVASKAAGGNVMFQNTSADGWSGFDMYNYAGSLKATIGYDNTNSDLMINSWYDRLRLQAGGAQVALLTNGNFGIGTTAPNYQLELTTDSAAKPNGGSWTNPSDIRLKENVRPFTDGLATLMNVTPKQWEYNGKGGSVAGSHGIGFVAQDVKDILPYAVGTFQMKLNPSDAMATTLYNFNPSSLDFIEINAIKELNAKIDAQQKEINELKAEIQVLEGK